MAETIKINDNTWRFEDDSVRFFLLCGNEKVALVDTGMNTPNAREMAENRCNQHIYCPKVQEADRNRFCAGDASSGSKKMQEILKCCV